jgi:hypothetical protein
MGRSSEVGLEIAPMNVADVLDAPKLPSLSMLLDGGVGRFGEGEPLAGKLGIRGSLDQSVRPTPNP